VSAEAILRAYGVDAATKAEQAARVAVLDRMGAFAPSERVTLMDAGLL
jgi:hypothetical protein